MYCIHLLKIDLFANTPPNCTHPRPSPATTQMHPPHVAYLNITAMSHRTATHYLVRHTAARLTAHSTARQCTKHHEIAQRREDRQFSCCWKRAGGQQAKVQSRSRTRPARSCSGRWTDGKGTPSTASTTGEASPGGTRIGTTLLPR